MPWLEMTYERRNLKGKGKLTTFVANLEQLNEKLERFEIQSITDLKVDGVTSTIDKVFSQK